jgi:hypothetical protein
MRRRVCAVYDGHVIVPIERRAKLQQIDVPGAARRWRGGLKAAVNAPEHQTPIQDLGPETQLIA